VAVIFEERVDPEATKPTPEEAEGYVDDKAELRVTALRVGVAAAWVVAFAVEAEE
jgi:hypothetical protein